MSMGFAEFLGELGEADLAAAMAEGRIVHAPAASEVAPAGLFDFDALDQLIRRLPQPAANVRIITKGRDIDLNSAHLLDADKKLRSLALRGLFRQGAGVVVNNVHHHVSALWDLTLDAERRLGDRISMAAVASYSAEAALPLHYDRSDVIVLQLEGSKLWRFHGTPIAGSAISTRTPADTLAEVTSVVLMRQGDILFVPQGQYHACEAQGRSLHLSLLVNHINLADYVGDQLAEVAALNVPLRPFAGADALAAQQSLLRSALLDLAEHIDLSGWHAAKNAAFARIGDDAGPSLDLDTVGAKASFATSLRPALRRDDMIAAAGAAMPATPALLAMIDVIAMDPRPVTALVDQAARTVGVDDARAALDQLIKVGLVTITVG